MYVYLVVSLVHIVVATARLRADTLVAGPHEPWLAPTTGSELHGTEEVIITEACRLTAQVLIEHFILSTLWCCKVDIISLKAQT